MTFKAEGLRLVELREFDSEKGGKKRHYCHIKVADKQTYDSLAKFAPDGFDASPFTVGQDYDVLLTYNDAQPEYSNISLILPGKPAGKF